jgi:hypothetical protein
MPGIRAAGLLARGKAASRVAALRRAFNVTGIAAADEKWDDPAEVVDLPPAEPMATKHDVELLSACIEELEPEQRSELVVWKNEQGFSWPWSIDTYNAIEAKLEGIVGGAAVEANDPTVGAEGVAALASPVGTPDVSSDPEGDGPVPSMSSSSGSEYTDADMEPFE